MTSNQPIGIFDSGMGGLTVANAVRKLLPNERIVYFGDSAHLPYGDKSAAAIQAYSVKICDVLLNEGCKVILIACNSASAAAYELVKEYVGSKAHVLNVIDPVINFLAEEYEQGPIGLIGTRQTVGSGVYADKLSLRQPQLTLKALSTPLLVPMIEEGFHNNDISGPIIANYLNDPLFDDIQALILGCTHYPLIKSHVEAFFTGSVNVIDSSLIVAEALQGLLRQHHLEARKPAEIQDRFLVSDFTPSFQAAAELFFQQRVSLEKHILWE